jgi:hypothetical protein
MAAGAVVRRAVYWPDGKIELTFGEPGAIGNKFLGR